MALWAIGDLHLSNQVDKPMDIFGTDWSNHPKRIRDHWLKAIKENDIILIPGDISWAMTLTEAQSDLEWIGSLPGKKILIRGNHDYWWSGISKVRNILPKDVYAIQNDAVRVGSITICGTRGWLLPSNPKITNHDKQIYAREVQRLQLSLEAAKKMGDPVVAMIHYPPAASLEDTTPITNLLDKYHVKLCVYGHLHGSAHRFAMNGNKNDTRYQLVSSDYIQFSPMLLAFDR